MPSPSRAPDASARIEALLPRGPVGGWVPRQPQFPAAPAGLVEASVAETVAPPVAVPSADSVVAEAVVAGPVALPSVAGLLRSARTDPGRRGVIALVCVGLVAALIAGVVVLRGRPSQVPLAAPSVVGTTDATGGPEVVVDVAGRVRRPGLVRLPSGARVDDALKAAGGVLPGASTGALNLARKLADGEQVLVGVDAPAGGGAAAGGTAAGGGGALLDLNTATAQDLDGLPGIGPVLADHIVSWRTEHGRFASVDQLREVPGIGESKYAQIKTKVTV